MDAEGSNRAPLASLSVFDPKERLQLRDRVLAWHAEAPSVGIPGISS